MADIAIIGLGGTGAVLGRALRPSLKDVAIAGYDPDSKLAKAAVESGAVDEVKRSIPEAIAGAHIVVLAAPMNATESAIQVVGQSAPPGCVVTDLCPLKTPVMDWAKRYLPPAISFVGGHVVQRDGENPLAMATYCILPGAGVQAGAVDAVTGLAKAVGAQPYFVDAMEHDSFMVATHYLSAIAAELAVDAALEGPSWPDVRRLWGEAFEGAIETSEADAFELSLLWAMDPSPIDAWLDKLSRQADVLRSRISAARGTGSAAETIATTADERRRRLAYMGGIEQPRMERSSTASLLLGDWLAHRRKRG